MDGANVEIAEEAGEENMFIFGLREKQVIDIQSAGYVDIIHDGGLMCSSRSYDPRRYIEKCPELKQVLEQIRSGYYSQDNPGVFNDIYNSIYYHDRFLICADFKDYMRAQEEVDKCYKVCRWYTFRLTNWALNDNCNCKGTRNLINTEPISTH